jgi:hypothetical protein
MVGENGRPERVRLDCIEYLGFCPTKDRFIGSDPAENSARGLTIEPATEVALEVYGQPDAQVRVYVRPHTPALIILTLLEKIATAIELEQSLRHELEGPPNGQQPTSGGSACEADEQGGGCCRRCRLSLREKSSIRHAVGLLCITCARELRLL